MTNILIMATVFVVIGFAIVAVDFYSQHKSTHKKKP